MKTYMFYLVQWPNLKKKLKVQAVDSISAFSMVPKGWEVSMFWHDWKKY